METLSRYMAVSTYPIIEQWFDEEYKRAMCDHANSGGIVDTFNQLDYAQKQAERAVRRKAKALLCVKIGF